MEVNRRTFYSCYLTSWLWHLWQSRSGNATLLWHTPQYLPSKISTIMAGTAIVSIYVINCSDVSRFGLHGKTDINMTKPAGEFCPVKPVIEHHGRKLGRFWIIVNDNSAILKWQRSSFFYTCLSKSNTYDKNQSSRKKSALFILCLLFYFIIINEKVKKTNEIRQLANK